MKPHDLSPEQEAEAQVLAEKILQKMQPEVLQMARQMVARPDHQLLGPGEFAVRDQVLRLGAIALETSVNDRKKRGTKVLA